ncbi:hypothetical protein [Brachyspira alvinipulli]|uniref:hypothetical protein n=1 Tax=Brachyspira alvinipulli TaxID=84379 RepID=UPI00048810D8|nr:hypothetical protein [Brachyspira alvinipulli]
MKRAIIYILLFILSVFNSSRLFAGIEIDAYIPFGINETDINSTVKNKDYTENSFKKFYDEIAAETGILVRGGYNFDLQTPIIDSLSLMLDIGYYMSPISISYVHSLIGTISETTLLHTLNTGLALKLYFYAPIINLYYSITLAGGVKTPFGGNVLNNSALGNESILSDKDAYGYRDIKNLFKTPVIGYLKYNVDFYYMLTEKVSIMYGLYLSYDFGMSYNTEFLNNHLKYYEVPPLIQSPIFGSMSYNNLSVGISFGLSFGKTHPKVKYGY